MSPRCCSLAIILEKGEISAQLKSLLSPCSVKSGLGILGFRLRPAKIELITIFPKGTGPWYYSGISLYNNL